MMASERTRQGPSAAEAEDHGRPEGRVRISEALKSLLEEKEFGAITWADIADTARVNEALIYKYFGTKRGLLHQVLHEYLEEAVKSIKSSTEAAPSTLEKLRLLVRTNIAIYDKHRVFSKILLLEVRNYPGYFTSTTYQQVRDYAKFVLEILEEGVRRGEIRDDVPPKRMRQILLGAMEHILLPHVIFGREMDPNELADDVCEVVFSGIRKR